MLLNTFYLFRFYFHLRGLVNFKQIKNLVSTKLCWFNNFAAVTEKRREQKCLNSESKLQSRNFNCFSLRGKTQLPIPRETSLILIDRITPGDKDFLKTEKDDGFSL